MSVSIRRLGFVALLALPWLWPFTSGPTAGVQPYLASMACAALLLALWPAGPDKDRVADAVAVGWFVAALLSAVIGLLQYFSLEGPLYPWVNGSGNARAFGNLRQPNQLATLLMIGLLALRMLEQRGRVGERWATWLGAPLLVALAATVSRIGLVELLAAGALVAWWGRGARQVWRRVGLAALLYAVAALVLPLLAQWDGVAIGRDMVERLSEGDRPCASRLTLWRNVLHLIALKPWAGWGWGELAWAHYMTRYDGVRFCVILDNAHNLPLHLAVTLGVPIALAVCAALAWLLWRGAPWREPGPARQLAWGVLLVIGLHSLVEYPLWYGPFQMAALISAWLLWRTRAAASMPAGRGRAVGLRLGAAALLLAATAYAGWDYWRVSQVYLPAEQRASWWREDPMAAARRSWLFAGAVRFAEVTTQPVTRADAAWMLAAAGQSLHYSPEPRVITRLIEAASLLGRDDVALAHMARFRAAFPADYRTWTRGNARLLEGAQRPQPAASGASP